VDRAGRGREPFRSGATVYSESRKARLVDRVRLDPLSGPAAVAGSGLLPEAFGRADSYEIVRSFFARIDQAAPGTDVLNRMIYSELKLRLPELLLMRLERFGRILVAGGRQLRHRARARRPRAVRSLRTFRLPPHPRSTTHRLQHLASALALRFAQECSLGCRTIWQLHDPVGYRGPKPRLSTFESCGQVCPSRCPRCGRTTRALT
jgi:hypothetical protein